MSDLDLSEAVEAAARAWADYLSRPFDITAPTYFMLSKEQIADLRRNEASVFVAAAAPLIEAQVRAQVAAEAVASDHDDAHRLLRDFAGGCGDNACPICVGAS